MRPRLEDLEDRLTPATIRVTTIADVVNPADGKVSLREAINVSNRTAERDTIALPAGVYKIMIPYNPANPNPNATGSFDILASARLVGAGAGQTVIDARQIDRAFAVTGTGPGSIDVLFQGLTVTGGSINGDGGGILMGNADLTLRDCVVARNGAAGDGAGVSNALAPGTGNLTLIDTTVRGNIASKNGGGIYLESNGTGQGSTLSLIRSTVRGNSAGGEAAGGGGGGIYADTANLTNSTVSGNKSGTFGGGIKSRTATLLNSTFRGNTAGEDGGGIQATTTILTNSTVSLNKAGGGGGGIEASTATLTNCTVSGNTAGKLGGGLWVATSATLTNCTVSGNTAGGQGGGIHADRMTLLNATIARNTAANGGGVFHDGSDPATVKNTIIALNGLTAGTSPDVYGDFTSGGHNLIGDGTGSTGFVATGDLLGTALNPIDPKLGLLLDNGGPTFTHALQAGSPAIDAGDNAGAPATDQRGVGRPRDGDGNGSRIIDIGAVEK